MSTLLQRRLRRTRRRLASARNPRQRRRLQRRVRRLRRRIRNQAVSTPPSPDPVQPLTDPAGSTNQQTPSPEPDNIEDVTDPDPELTSPDYVPHAVPSAADLHVMNRLTAGFTPGLWEAIRTAGGAAAWFEKQLALNPATDNAKTLQTQTWFPSLTASTAQISAAADAGLITKYGHIGDLANATLLRRMYSDHQVREVMVDVWSSHLHVSPIKDPVWMGRASYDRVIRKHALGRFDEMLVEATLHPAMLVYLDNWRSRRGAPNENHGRELLELHTVGRSAGYTEAMVKGSAVALSGWAVNNLGEAYYEPAFHTTGPIDVLGFRDANTGTTDKDLARRYVAHLAHHPATARTVAVKLARRFIGGSFSAETISTVARAYLDSGTDIKATLRALLSTAEFRAAVDGRVRSPFEDLVASARAARIDIHPPTSKSSAAHQLATLTPGLPLYCWLSPDGPPDRDSAWAGPAALLNAFSIHWLMLGGLTAKDGATAVTMRDLVDSPQPLGDIIDHLHRVLLGRPAPASVLRAAAAAVGTDTSTVVDPAKVSTQQFQLIASTILDSPLHLKR